MIQVHRITVFGNIKQNYLLSPYAIRPVIDIIGAALKNFSMWNKKTEKIIHIKYEILVQLPLTALTPVTTPLDEPIVATVVVPLLQVPPPVLDNVVVAAWHIVAVPVIVAAIGVTDTACVAAVPQPVL